MKSNAETNHDAEAAQASTTLTTPREVRARYEAAARALSEALGRKRAMIERAATMARAGEAAQAQANAACERYRGLLRQAGGELTREIQKLRASERSSLALVEEHAAMRQEIATQIVSMELEVAELAEKGIDLRNSVLELASREAFDALMAQAGDAMATAYVLHRRAALSPLLARIRPSDDQVFTGFLHQLGQQIKMRSNTVNEAVAEVIGVQGLELDGVDMSLAASPARRANQRRTLQSSVPTFFPD
ncbi:hypothetical protein [Xanthomonas campestris]|uniref:hypothetical protein n=1 Tax=Xanthomonas campestris TaxID=339 RepID=UPI001E2FD225|nr:hypothetical protein [Xanthomonas campestris]WVL60380.1 hypothetical protein LLE68_019380 [Xanthomonas campestris pv. barbareae]